MKLKDKKIELLKQVHIRDAEGFTTTTLEPVATVWAYFRQLSGKERFTGYATVAEEEALFQISYRTDITTAHIIRYRGIDYNITRIDTFEGYKEDLTLYAKRK